MKIYKKYDSIFTFDDKIFHNKDLLPSCLSANNYLYLKNNDSREIDFYYEKNKPDRIVKELDNVYIFIFNRGKQSGGNFFHFHFHYLQRLLGFFLINDNSVKLGLPLNMIDFQKNTILRLVPEDKIIYLDIYKYNYEITNCYVGNYLDISTIPEFLLDKYQIMGYNIITKNLLTPKYENNIFIARRIKNNAGASRCINNNIEFLNCLLDKEFKLIYFEDYNFEDKIINLIKLNPKLIVIENGSGLTNFMFLPKQILENIFFIILDQENWKLKTSRIYDIILKFNIKHEILTCESITYNESDIQNNPFIINIDEFNNIYDNYINSANSSNHSS